MRWFRDDDAWNGGPTWTDLRTDLPCLIERCYPLVEPVPRGPTEFTVDTDSRTALEAERDLFAAFETEET